MTADRTGSNEAHVWVDLNAKHSELVEVLKVPTSIALDEISEDTWEHYDEHRHWLETWLEPMIQ
jgi:hypothetical protein